MPTYIQTYLHAYTHTRSHKHIFIYIYTHTGIPTRLQKYIHSYRHVYQNVYVTIDRYTDTAMWTNKFWLYPSSRHEFPYIDRPATTCDIQGSHRKGIHRVAGKAAGRRRKRTNLQHLSSATKACHRILYSDRVVETCATTHVHMETSRDRPRVGGHRGRGGMETGAQSAEASRSAENSCSGIAQVQSYCRSWQHVEAKRSICVRRKEAIMARRSIRSRAGRYRKVETAAPVVPHEMCAKRTTGTVGCGEHQGHQCCKHVQAHS